MSLLDYVKARVVEEGDCWIWTRTVRRRQPEMNSSHGRGSVRRYMWAFLTGKSARKDAYINTKCGDPRCVNPDHLRQQTISTVRKRQKISDTQKHKIAITARKKSSLDIDKVRAIRADERTNEEIAKDYGTSDKNIYKIKKNLAWREYANPWRGL